MTVWSIVLPARHTRWCGVTTVFAMLLAAPAWALPSAASTLDAYQTARGTLDALAVPGEPAEIEASGVAITIRVSGRVAGYAAVWDTGGSAFDDALEQALDDFLQTELAPRDATRLERLRELAARATVQVELADALTPISGETFGLCGMNISPGLQGAAARVGERVRAVFPDRMLSTNTSPAQGLNAACSAHGLPTNPLIELRDRHAVRLFRFDVVSAGQTKPNGPAVFFHRSGRVRRLTSVIGSELEAFGGSLAGSLIGRVWDRDGASGFLGTYHPTRDEYTPFQAEPREQALAALALARWARVTGSADAERTATLLLAGLAKLDELDLSTAALVLLAFEALDRPEEFRALETECASVLELEDASDSLSERGLVAAALAMRGDEAARTMVSDLLTTAGRGGVVSAAPWVVWAAVELAGDGPAGGAPALRDGRDVVWEHQLTRRDAGVAEADLVGGVVYTASSQPLPTAQSARAAALASAMLGHTSLTPKTEMPGELAKLLQTLRFLRQLTVEEAEARMFPNPERAMGGVRLALWDQRQPVEATALTLIAVAETLEAARK